MKRIIITEEQLTDNFLTEVIGNHKGQYQYQLDFSGNNDNRQTNDKNFLDWLYANGQIGKLPPSKLTQTDIKEQIEYSYNATLDYYISENNEYVGSFFPEWLQDHGYDIYNVVNHWDMIDNYEIEENLKDEESKRLFKRFAMEMYKSEGNDFDYYSLDINDRGLIYIEREIVVPDLFSTYAHKQNEKQDYFNILDNTYYDSAGVCWTYRHGNAQYQDRVGYGTEKSHHLVLKAYVDPKDVLWDATISLHGQFAEEEELRLDYGAPIEIFEIEVHNLKNRPKLNLNGQTILFKA